MPSIIAQPVDARMNNRFRLLIDHPFGTLNSYSAQEVTLPDQEIVVKEHGEGGAAVNRKVATGKKKIGELVVRRLLESASADLGMQQWLDYVTTADPSEYKRNVTLQEFGADGETVVVEQLLVGVFPTKIPGRKFMANDEGDIMYEEITFSVDDVQPQ